MAGIILNELREKGVKFSKRNWPRVRVEELLEWEISPKELNSEFKQATLYTVEGGMKYGIMLVSKGSEDARPLYWIGNQ